MSNKFYNYAIKQLLPKDIDNLKNSDYYGNIYLCVYLVNLNGKDPFLQYLLSNNEYEALALPVLPMYNSLHKHDIISYSEVYLSGILGVSQFEPFSNNIMFDGFFEYNDDLYLFFDITKCEINIDETYSYSNVRLALMDEIVNHASICNIQIDYTTTTFFIENQSLMYLYDEKSKPYEVPVVGYVGKPTEQKVNFVMTFGESAKNKSEIVGPYFYFTNFQNAIRQGGWTATYKEELLHGTKISDKYGRYKKGGIVRFALFTGPTKYVENAPNDANDESVIKKHRLEDDHFDRKKEMLTLRISDHDGIWAKTYDSVIIGQLELDDGSFLEDTPMYVVKQYDQQTPLSCHFIDKNRLGEKYDKNEYYSIL
jgi:hypothetical protein